MGNGILVVTFSFHKVEWFFQSVYIYQLFDFFITMFCLFVGFLGSILCFILNLPLYLNIYHAIFLFFSHLIYVYDF
jgi:hypothetical protein